MLTPTIIKESAERANVAHEHAEILRNIRSGLQSQLSALEEQIAKAEADAEGLQNLYQAQQEAFDKQTDKWVEDLGTFGAMKLHPREFSADEIIAEFNADNLSEMTLPMAEVITDAYPETTEGMEPEVFFVVEHALSIF